MIGLQGTRLAFVVRELEGEVSRPTIKFKTTRGKGAKATDRHEMVVEQTTEPAGYMVYFPRGHALRFKDKEALAIYGLDQQAEMVNLEGLHDPNSPFGKLFRAQNEEQRRQVFTDLEEQVVSLVHRTVGKDLLSVEA